MPKIPRNMFKMLSPINNKPTISRKYKKVSVNMKLGKILKTNKNPIINPIEPPIITDAGYMNGSDVKKSAG